VANVQVFDFRPAIDQHRLWILLEQGMGGAGVEVVHAKVRKLESGNIMKAS
jgi:hypothetical protein